MLSNQLLKVKSKDQEGTCDGFYLQKCYENKLELEFLFQVNFQSQRRNQSNDSKIEEESESDATKRWAKQAFKYSITCINFAIYKFHYDLVVFKKEKCLKSGQTWHKYSNSNSF